MEHKETVCEDVDLIHVLQDWDRCWFLVNTVLNIGFLVNTVLNLGFLVNTVLNLGFLVNTNLGFS
jgi:hypothetical protein